MDGLEITIGSQDKREETRKSNKHKTLAEPVNMAREKFQHSNSGELETTGASCCQRDFFKSARIVFLAVSLITIFKALVVIVVSISTAVAIKVYITPEYYGKLVTLDILAVTAGVTLSTIIYALVGAFKKQRKQLYITVIVLLILSMIQSVVIGISLVMSPEDELKLEKSLKASFAMAKSNSVKNLEIWSATQHTLRCCGVRGPEDYRSFYVPHYMPPNVPISCCANYDPDRSELLQERHKEICRIQRQFYEIGCLKLVIYTHKRCSQIVLCVSAVFMLFELLAAFVAALLCTKLQIQPRKNNQETPQLSK